MVREGYKEVQLGIKTTLIPNQWLVKNIDDIVDLTLNSVDPTKLDKKSVKLYSMPAFDENKEPKIIGPKEIGSSKYIVPEECLLFAKLNPRKKRIWLINNEVDYSLCSTEFWPLVKKDENINLDFLHYYFFSYDFQSNPIIKPASSTNSHKRIKRKSFKKVNIPIPPLPEQKKIASILSSVDNSIEKTDELIEETKKLKKGLMQQLLTKGVGHKKFKEVRIGPQKVKIPKSWEIRTLNSIKRKIYAGGTPSRSNEKYFNGDIPWVKSGELNQNFISSIEEKITNEALENSSAKMVPENNVLVAMYGATAGQVGYLKQKAATNQAVLAIVPEKELINSLFLYYLLSKEMSRIVKQRQQGTGQQNLSKTLIKDMGIFVPSLDEQKKIASILSSVDAKIKKEEEYKAKLERLKKGLMQKLLTGEIRVNTDMEV